jgi:hypothetical protein
MAAKGKKSKLTWQQRRRFLDAHSAGDVAGVKHWLAEMPEMESFMPNSGTWIHQAAMDGHVRLIQFWLDRGLKVDQNVPSYSKRHGVATPLGYAKNAAVTRFLLKKGAAVNTWSRYGGTPLHRAAQMNDPEMIATLLKAGADPAITDADGRTPLGVAIEYKRRKAEQALREAGAPLDGHPPSDRKVPTAPPPIDLRKDVARITTTLTKAAERFAKQHRDETVTAVALAASGIEGYVTVCIDTGTFQNSPWDAEYAEYATVQFPKWREAYELADRGPVRITEVDGKLVSPRGDTKFQAPFYRACLAALKEFEKSPALAKLNCAKPFVIGVEISSGDHAKFWKPTHR